MPGNQQAPDDVGIAFNAGKAYHEGNVRDLEDVEAWMDGGKQDVMDGDGQNSGFLEFKSQLRAT